MNTHKTLLFLLAIILFIPACSKNMSNEAWINAQDLISDGLTSKKSAVFEKREVNDLGNGEFEIVANLDCANPMGVVITRQVVAVVKRDGEKWSIKNDDIAFGKTTDDTNDLRSQFACNDLKQWILDQYDADKDRKSVNAEAHAKIKELKTKYNPGIIDERFETFYETIGKP